MRRRWRGGRWERGPVGISGLYPLLVLLLVKKGYSYGYEIKKRMEEFLGYELPPGMIYVTLTRLEDQGLLASKPLLDHPRGKRVYQITALGEEVLKARIEELKHLKSLIERILSLEE